MDTEEYIMTLTNADKIEIRNLMKTWILNNADKIMATIQTKNEADAVAAKTINDANIQIAVDWWNTVKPAIPLTRDEALTAYRFIDGLLDTETDSFRLELLGKKLLETNEKFKERKRNV